MSSKLVFRKGFLVPINRNLVSAPLADLRRLSLLAALVQAGNLGEDVDPDAAAKALEPVFSGLPTCLDEDIMALCEEGLIIRDQSLAATRNVTVLTPGHELAERLKTLVDNDKDALTAVVAAMVLHYMHCHKDRTNSMTTESLRNAGITVFGTPLPDDCVEEALRELFDQGLIDGTKGHQGARIIHPKITVKGFELVRSGRPVLLLDDGHTETPSAVFNTTFNGNIHAQNVAVASQGDVNQEAMTVNVDQAMADLRCAVDALYTALEGQADLQDKLEELLEQLDEAEDQESKSRMVRVLSALHRLAHKAAVKIADAAIARTVAEAVPPLLNALGN